MTEEYVSLSFLMLTESDLGLPRRLGAGDKGEGSRDLRMGPTEGPRNPEDHQKVPLRKSHLAMSTSGNKARASGDTTVGKPTAPFDGGGGQGHPDAPGHGWYRRNSRK